MSIILLLKKRGRNVCLLEPAIHHLSMPQFFSHWKSQWELTIALTFPTPEAGRRERKTSKQCFLHCLCTLFHCILTPQFIAMRPLLLLFYSFLFPEKYSQPLLCELPVIEAYCLFFLSFQGLTYSLTTPSSSFIPFSLLLFLCFLIKHCCILLLYPFVKFYNSWFLFYQSIWAHCQILL